MPLRYTSDEMIAIIEGYKKQIRELTEENRAKYGTTIRLQQKEISELTTKIAQEEIKVKTLSEQVANYAVQLAEKDGEEYNPEFRRNIAMDWFEHHGFDDLEEEMDKWLCYKNGYYLIRVNNLRDAMDVEEFIEGFNERKIKILGEQIP